MSKDYLPQGDAAAVLWLTNFKTKIATLGASMGVLPAEITALQGLCTSWITQVQAVDTKKGELAAALKTRDSTAQSSGASIRNAIKKMKAAGGYTEAIGEELGIKTMASEMDTANFKATISAERFAGHVRIKFIKSDTDGINLYHRKKGDIAWKFLARDTKSPYDDHITLEVPGQPEHWEYRAFAVIDDAEIGQASDIVEMVYGG